jgi:hypothetical protein
MYTRSANTASHALPCTVPCAVCHMPCTMYHVPCVMCHVPCHVLCYVPCAVPCAVPCTMCRVPCHVPCAICRVPCAVHVPFAICATRLDIPVLVYTSVPVPVPPSPHWPQCGDGRVGAIQPGWSRRQMSQTPQASLSPRRQPHSHSRVRRRRVWHCWGLALLKPEQAPWLASHRHRQCQCLRGCWGCSGCRNSGECVNLP